MALTKLTANLNTHQSLPDQPALTAEELKALWDEAPNAIKDYLNQILTIELEQILESKVDKVVGKVLSSNDFTDALKTKLNGIANNANNYSHPTNSGNKHIPSGGSSGQILRWSSDGTASWGADNNTTYGVATTSSNGLMSSSDKNKLNGIANNANNYSHPTNSGNKHIPSGGSSGQILRWASDGTATWGADNNTTYGVATTSANGLMSSIDKAKLNGIANNATKNTIENTLSSTSTVNGLSAYQGKVLKDYYNGNVLYNNTSGTISAITLSDSIANYTYVEIFYYDSPSARYNSVKVYSPNNKYIELNINGETYVYNAVVKISGKSLTWSQNMRIVISDGTKDINSNTIKIVRVMGYK